MNAARPARAATQGPAWSTPRGVIASLRRTRQARRIARDIDSGRWREALLGAKLTQHLYPAAEKHGERIGELLTKVDLVRLAMRKHADVIANRPVRHSVDEGHEDQDYALDAIRERCMFDGLFHEAVMIANVEGHAVLRADMDDAGEETGVVMLLDDNDVAFPVGPLGPDRQPTVWERRWIVRRDDVRGQPRYLRVERHRAPGGVGVVEQEAYLASGPDPLVELADLRRVPLAAAIPPGASVPPDTRPTGLRTPAIVQLVLWREMGEPAMRITPDDLDLIDASAAHFSRLNRAMGMHGRPKLRVSEDMIDPETGALRAKYEAFVDPEKNVEYIDVKFAWEQMMDFMDKVLAWLLVTMEISPSLIGVKPAAGAAPDSADKLRLEATNTLASAQRASPYMNGALGRLFAIATELDAMRPLVGYAVAPVKARVRPELPKDTIDRGREQGELLGLGLTSEQRAIAEIHGEDQVDAVLAEIAEDRSAAAQRQSAALGMGLGFNAPLPTPDDAAIGGAA